MDLETQKRVFEPFFTTKPLGRGTGLGLSTVYGIVQQCGGSIEINSQPGAGTAFHVSFPIVESPKLQDDPVGITKSQLGSECILIVEDDEDLRNLYQDILNDSGYRVLTAENGRTALDLIETTNERFDLIISDAIMPIMGGIELFESLQTIRPELKLLLMSGYEGGRVDRPNALPHVDLLAKPFRMKVFTAKVRHLLDEVSAKQ
jgi:CheY-like chemotaxis protein